MSTHARIGTTALVVLACALAGGLRPAFGHGALSGDDDACKLSIGPYSMHFIGYQPSQSGNTEFCEDIPNTGQTIIVLESIDEMLKDMEVGIRIATASPAGAENEADVIFEQPYRGNSRGSITVMQNFGSKGNFIGIVSARSSDNEYVARFPFSVGLPPAETAASAGTGWVWPGLAALLLIIAVLVGWRFMRRDRAAAEAGGG